MATVRWEVVVVLVAEVDRLLEDGWEPFSAAATSGPDGVHYVYLRRQRK